MTQVVVEAGHINHAVNLGALEDNEIVEGKEVQSTGQFA